MTDTSPEALLERLIRLNNVVAERLEKDAKARDKEARIREADAHSRETAKMVESLTRTRWHPWQIVTASFTAGAALAGALAALLAILLR